MKSAVLSLVGFALSLNFLSNTWAGPLETQLMEAILKANSAEIDASLENRELKLDEPIQKGYFTGWTPLALAAALKHSVTVKKLLKSGAKVSVNATLVSPGGARRNYSPLILLAQAKGKDEDLSESFRDLLERFTSTDYTIAIQQAETYSQSDFKEQLIALQAQHKRQQAVAHVPTCKNRPDSFPEDPRALHLVNHLMSCLICKKPGPPGQAGQSRLLNGAHRIGNTVECYHCHETFCEECADSITVYPHRYHPTGETRLKCPGCEKEEDRLSFLTYRTQVPEFSQWKVNEAQSNTRRVRLPTVAGFTKDGAAEQYRNELFDAMNEVDSL